MLVVLFGMNSSSDTLTTDSVTHNFLLRVTEKYRISISVPSLGIEFLIKKKNQPVPLKLKPTESVTISEITLCSPHGNFDIFGRVLGSKLASPIV